MTSETFRCADASAARDEPLFGTASFVRRWLLLEQPGAWGGNALLESRLPARVAKELRARAAAAGVRVVLIRRGPRLSTGRRQCYFLRSDEHDAYAAHISLDSATDVLDVDLAPLREGGPIQDASPLERPLFLVCTHGRHDACCSIKGNRVARVACAQPEMDSWECSHIGGDRFAANLVCFPHGVYYGRVGAGDAVTLMSAYARGEVALENYRGRCCYPFPVQAAEYFVRRETGFTGLDDVSLLSSETLGDRIRVSFDAGARIARVEVAVTESGSHRLTCGAKRSLPIPRFDLVSMALE